MSDRKLTTPAIRFITYQFVRADGPLVDWLEVVPDYLNRHETILAAGYEPEDLTVKMGVLNDAWHEHPEGCLLVADGEFREGERFALSVVALPSADE